MSRHRDSASPAGSFDQHHDIALRHTHPRPDLAYAYVYPRSDDTASIGSTPASSVSDVPSQRILQPGVYVPTVAFFDKTTEDLDLQTTANHAVRLARAGVTGIATQGSNGEAVHLSREERKSVTRVTRQALNDAGYFAMPIIVGCGSQSTRETIELCSDAALSGGDYALVLPPSYYKPAYGPDALIGYFHDVADSSPLPILIYNYPGAVAGIDLDSDTIVTLAKHPNIVGCKLTCGNTGKLNRIAAATQAATPFDLGSGFMCMGGSADFTLQMLVGGGSGVICGLGNVAPKACVAVFDLYNNGEVLKAQQLQKIIARGDWAAITGGIKGTKSVLETYFGYGGYPRRPIAMPTEQECRQFEADFKEVIELENSL